MFKAADHGSREVGLTKKENESVECKRPTSTAMGGRTLENMFKVFVKTTATATSMVNFVVSFGEEFSCWPVTVNELYVCLSLAWGATMDGTFAVFPMDKVEGLLSPCRFFKNVEFEEVVLCGKLESAAKIVKKWSAVIYNVASG